MEDLYPYRTDGLCRCGCGEKAVRVWAKGHADKCVERFLILKGDNKAIRGAVFRRDHGICALCKMDTEAERARCQQWHPPDSVCIETWSRGTAELRIQRMLQGFPQPIETWWQADHIVPVVRGGGCCELEGFRTLCIVCHKAVTAQLAAELAADRACKNRRKALIFAR